MRLVKTNTNPWIRFSNNLNFHVMGHKSIGLGVIVLESFFTYTWSLLGWGSVRSFVRLGESS
jgi:hypothetical protein